MRKSLRERVLSHLVIDPDTGCLLWTGPCNHKGYGKIVQTVGGQHLYLKPHRLMYEWFVGPIPDGLQIDHLCRVRHCAAPAHLEAVTCKENIRRGLAGAHWAAKRAAKRAAAQALLTSP